jgi:hypothetical protein
LKIKPDENITQKANDLVRLSGTFFDETGKRSSWRIEDCSFNIKEKPRPAPEFYTQTK